MLEKITNFIKNYDIRWKFLIIGKRLGIKVYPTYFNLRGLKSLVFKIFFNLIINEKLKKKKKQFLKEIYEVIELEENQKANFLISSPSSGGNFIRHLLSSYFEIKFKTGNGIPKFDNQSNKWIFNSSPIMSGDLFNFIILERYPFNYNIIPKEEYKKKKIFISRYPYESQNVILYPDFFKIDEMKPIILFRDPLEWIVSRYCWREDIKFQNTDIIDKLFIQYDLNNYNKYLSYWLNYVKNTQNEKYLLIEFKNIINDEKKTFLKILNFLNYELLEEKKINQILKINSKEFALENLGTEFMGTRFTNNIKKENAKKKISNFSNEYLKKNKITLIYDELKQFVNIIK
jgi:hypothetical protein